ncbi:MAG: DUF11 domain-containing protein, partial [Acidobacteriota bacterium]
IPEADVSVVKTLDSPGPFTAGDTIQYTLVVSNAGPDAATNVVVTDSPSNLTLTSVSSANCSSFPCTIPSLGVGMSETIAVEATIDMGGAFDNVTTVSADELDPDPSNNTDDSGNGGNAVPAADVSVVKTLDSPGPFNTGDTVLYTLVVSNAGPDAATNVVVTDSPSNLTLTSVSSTNCSSFPCTIPSLGVGMSETIAVEATIDMGGFFENVATVSADESDPDPSNNTDDSGGKAGFVADVAVTKSIDPMESYLVGDSVTFSLLVTNIGPDTATNVVITDTPINLEITDVLGDNCATLPCTLDSLASGESELIIVVATILSEGDFLNQTSVMADEVDPDLTNNEDLGADGDNGGTAVSIIDIPVNAGWAMVLLILALGFVGIRTLLRN